MENEHQKQLQIELKPDVATGVYSNLAVVANTPSEFVMDFIAMLPGVPKAEVRSRIIMTPEHAKRMMLALQNNLQKYEERYGTIKGDVDPRNAMPFNFNTFNGGGEA